MQPLRQKNIFFIVIIIVVIVSFISAYIVPMQSHSLVVLIALFSALILAAVFIGTVMSAMYIRKYRSENVLFKKVITIRDILRLESPVFKDYVAWLVRRHGYAISIIQTQASKISMSGKRKKQHVTIVAYQRPLNHLVDGKDVQTILENTHHDDAQIVIMTTSSFEEGVIAQYSSHRHVMLVDGVGFEKMTILPKEEDPFV